MSKEVKPVMLNKQIKSNKSHLVASKSSLRRSINFLNKKASSTYHRLCHKSKYSLENGNSTHLNKPERFSKLKENIEPTKTPKMSTTTPLSSRLMTPTKAYSAKQMPNTRTPSVTAPHRTPLTQKTLSTASNRTPFASKPPMSARTPMSSRQTPSNKAPLGRTPLQQQPQKQFLKTPRTVGANAPRLNTRTHLTVGRAPINTSTINRRLFQAKTTPNSKANNPIVSKARTADAARLISVRKSINTLHSPLNSCTTPPEAKTPSSKLFRKIFASGNSGTKIPLRTGHFKEFQKECNETTPMNKNLAALKKKQRRSSRRSTDFKGLDDEACLLITPSLMRKLICSGGRADELKKDEDTVKVHSVKPSSILKYLFKERNAEKENKITEVAMDVKEVKKVEEVVTASSSGLFKAQELVAVATSSGSANTRVFGNAYNISKDRPSSIFSTVTLKESPIAAREVKTLDEEKKDLSNDLKTTKEAENKDKMLEQSKTPTPKMSIENTPEATVTPSCEHKTKAASRVSQFKLNPQDTTAEFELLEKELNVPDIVIEKIDEEEVESNEAKFTESVEDSDKVVTVNNEILECKNELETSKVEEPSKMEEVANEPMEIDVKDDEQLDVNKKQEEMVTEQTATANVAIVEDVEAKECSIVIETVKETDEPHQHTKPVEAPTSEIEEPKTLEVVKSQTNEAPTVEESTEIKLDDIQIVNESIELPEAKTNEIPITEESKSQETIVNQTNEASIIEESTEIQSSDSQIVTEPIETLISEIKELKAQETVESLTNVAPTVEEPAEIKPVKNPVVKETTEPTETQTTEIPTTEDSIVQATQLSDVISITDQTNEETVSQEEQIDEPPTHKAQTTEDHDQQKLKLTETNQINVEIVNQQTKLEIEHSEAKIIILPSAEESEDQKTVETNEAPVVEVSSEIKSIDNSLVKEPIEHSEPQNSNISVTEESDIQETAETQTIEEPTEIKIIEETTEIKPDDIQIVNESIELPEATTEVSKSQETVENQTNEAPAIEEPHQQETKQIKDPKALEIDESQSNEAPTVEEQTEIKPNDSQTLKDPIEAPTSDIKESKPQETQEEASLMISEPTEVLSSIDEPKTTEIEHHSVSTGTSLLENSLDKTEELTEVEQEPESPKKTRTRAKRAIKEVTSEIASKKQTTTRGRKAAKLVEATDEQDSTQETSEPVLKPTRTRAKKVTKAEQLQVEQEVKATRRGRGKATKAEQEPEDHENIAEQEEKSQEEPKEAVVTKTTRGRGKKAVKVDIEQEVKVSKPVRGRGKKAKEVEELEVLEVKEAPKTSRARKGKLEEQSDEQEVAVAAKADEEEEVKVSKPVRGRGRRGAKAEEVKEMEVADVNEAPKVTRGRARKCKDEQENEQVASKVEEQVEVVQEEEEEATKPAKRGKAVAKPTRARAAKKDIVKEDEVPTAATSRSGMKRAANDVQDEAPKPKRTNKKATEVTSQQEEPQQTARVTRSRRK